MQANNLKYTLLDKLISIQDIKLLEKVNAIIGNEDINASVFKITENQKSMLLKKR